MPLTFYSIGGHSGRSSSRSDDAACFQPVEMEEAVILGGIRCFFYVFSACNLKAYRRREQVQLCTDTSSPFLVRLDQLVYI